MIPNLTAWLLGDTASNQQSKSVLYIIVDLFIMNTVGLIGKSQYTVKRNSG